MLADMQGNKEEGQKDRERQRETERQRTDAVHVGKISGVEESSIQTHLGSYKCALQAAAQTSRSNLGSCGRGKPQHWLCASV